jgi:thiol-disulfide isomerase/thioredoxin
MKPYKIIIILLVTGLFFLIKPVSFTLLPDPAVEVIDVKKLKEIINNRNGKPLLVNVWATWCVPCREEFPELVKITDKFGDRVDMIGISVDFPEEKDSKVVPFLKEQKVEFKNYIIKVVEPEDFINLLNEDWNGAVPATFIYDKKGAQKEFLLGKQSYSDFENGVKKIIN